MSGLRRMTTAVSVATVWTKPESPRPSDEPALARPAGIRSWLEGMSIAERLDLCESDRVQTQILYGTAVLVAEEQGDWIKVLIPEQGTPKEELGYPGWVPRRQLAEEEEAPVGSQRAEVVSSQTWLYKEANPTERWIELSFLTSLPVIEASGSWVKVRTPEGAGYLLADEVRLICGVAGREAAGSYAAVREPAGNSTAACDPAEGHTGRSIVEQAQRFLGLPYLWGGMSSFGYDCSGFAYNMHKSAGILIPRDASAQARQGALIERERLEPGDLLFFAHEEGKGAVHHVGIYAGDGRMIHSPETGKCIEIVDLSTYRPAKEHCITRRYWG